MGTRVALAVGVALRSFAAVALLALAASSARAFDPELPLSQLQVTVFDRASGLPGTSSVALARTDDGYLWIATGLGLVRFDGRLFAALRRATDPGLPSDAITYLRW